MERRTLEVPFDAAPDRLDRFLVGAFPDLTRSQIKRLIDEGSVLLDGAVAKSALKLRGGETVSVTLPEPSPVETVPEAIPLTILYEDSSLIVIDKPAGMVVHPAPGHPGGTLVNALLHHCEDLAGIGGELRPGIVHRLDRDTSGVIVASKNDHAHLDLARQFKEHSSQRRYRALVHGLVEPSEGTIDQPIGRHPVHRKKMSTHCRHGRRAVTHWRVLRRYELDRLSLLELRLETGRTHQIRVHLSALGYPVAGDPLYGNPRLARGLEDAELGRLIGGLNRQFLHAWLLGFTHPEAGQYQEFHSPMPPELQGILDFLEEKYTAALNSGQHPG
ncbi:MAG: RluA family pseudouridine synthase [Desulfuromonadales bacterium]|nr:RluA family pseudouridine synthase [Desulfuromonadales bacterium]